ncbi:hypothetical protein [Providencia burhodogranariea]|uniref:Uncharacterized protein n=1 Tax=Providencia burhodogranariea DSM 19968 TaxID=1141662 RepID=K8WXI1_9GAMM|nr:hypothetical protein OOA_02527 [Providencia burhodogranariea DSM 19968]
MKIDFISIKEPETSSSSESDFKDVLKSCKGDSKTVKAVRKISSANKYEKNKKKPKTLKSFIISPIFDLYFNSDNKRTHDDINQLASKTKNNKITSIDSGDEKLSPSDMLQQMNTSMRFTFFLNEIDVRYYINNKKIQKNEYGITNFFVQRASQEKLMLHPNYINTKTSRDYQVYYKGQRYYFNINENDVLSRIEDKNDGS